MSHSAHYLELLKVAKTFGQTPATSTTATKRWWCEECDMRSIAVHRKSGERVCYNCGTVKGDIMDDTPDWNQFGQAVGTNTAEDPCRATLVNPLLPKSSTSTRIGYCPGGCRELFALSKTNHWISVPYSERSLARIFAKLFNCCAAAGIGASIVERAKRYYMRAYEKNNGDETVSKAIKPKKGAAKKLQREGMRGSKREGLVAACLYFACKHEKIARSKSEIATIMNLPKPEVTRGCNIFQRLLKNDAEVQPKSSNVIKCEPFVRQYCAYLKVSDRIVQLSLAVVRQVKRLGILSSNTPPSLSCGCIALVLKALKAPVNDADISKACGISKVTVTNVCKSIEPWRMELMTRLFSEELCRKVNIVNPITLRKTVDVALAMSKLPGKENKDALCVSALAVYMVARSYCLVVDSSQLCYHAGVAESALCKLYQKMALYRDALVQDVIFGSDQDY